MAEKIIIKGAREHNLKDISLELPKNKLVVFTGVSGSGKSSLAFDTIYAEGQRRYVESLSAYARQFLGLFEKPDVDSIEGLSPSISIDQKSASHNPRSTVGTITEIYDYLRLLFARVGIPHCPICGKDIVNMTSQQMVDVILRNGTGKLLILAPMVRGRKGTYEELFTDLKRKGFARVRVNKALYELDQTPKLDRYKAHDIEVVVDRLILPVERQRLTESVETALKLASGTIKTLFVSNRSGEKETNFSEKFYCSNDQISLPELEPRSFSFNSPYGACPNCDGLGSRLEADPELVLNPNLSVAEGGILPWARLQTKDSWYSNMLESLSARYKFSLKDPIGHLNESVKQVLLYGAGNETFHITYRNRFRRLRSYWSGFDGVVNHLMARYHETESEWVKGEIAKYMRGVVCSACQGSRLKKEALAVTISDQTIADVTNLSIAQAKEFFNKLNLSKKETHISDQILKEIKARLKFLIDVGLDYLTLERTALTLAGGEAQRIRLASQIGSGLTGVIYVLDEPSIGLHPKDNDKLISTLKELRDLGNSVIVVEHDAFTILSADWVVDMGPGAGEHGGKIISQGSPDKLKKDPNSLTGQYLTYQKKVGEIIAKERVKNENKLVLIGASEHNLKEITVEFPLGKLICVTGVSGSGKSSLINDTLYPILASRIYGSRVKLGKHQDFKGYEFIDKVVNIDQSPIGRTPRSNPVTYTGTFSYIRELFARTQLARERGYSAGRFSFNVKGGRCETCEGGGVIKIEMQFLPDVYVTCETCEGKRYNREALEVEYKGKTIADVLDLTVEEGREFFENIPTPLNKLKTLDEVGLGYMKLGQSATTLSGGEAQRIKLSTELSKRATGKTLYILDEPTTGLHFADIENLINVLHKLVGSGNTVVVVEHNLDVIKTADFIIDLGPEGGDKGGELICAGEVKGLIANQNSHTGKFLKEFIKLHS